MRKNFCLTLAAISVVACGGGGASSTSPTTTPIGNTPPPSGGISVSNNAFSPDAKAVAIGSTVQWAWNTCSSSDPYGGGETCVAHSVTFDDGVDSGTKDKGTFSRTFNAAGTYNYHCIVHGAAMAGKIIVQ